VTNQHGKQRLMKRLFIAGLGLACAAAMTINAQAADHKNLTDEQKAVLQEMLAKYDTNKDGKLEKDERAKMTKEDKKTWAKAIGISFNFGKERFKRSADYASGAFFLGENRRVIPRNWVVGTAHSAGART